MRYGVRKADGRMAYLLPRLLTLPRPLTSRDARGAIVIHRAGPADINIQTVLAQTVALPAPLMVISADWLARSPPWKLPKPLISMLRLLTEPLAVMFPAPLRLTVRVWAVRFDRVTVPAPLMETSR